MKKTNITLTFDDDKLDALEFFPSQGTFFRAISNGRCPQAAL